MEDHRPRLRASRARRSTPGRGSSGPVPGCCRRSPTPAARPRAARGARYGGVKGNTGACAWVPLQAELARVAVLNSLLAFFCAAPAPVLPPEITGRSCGASRAQISTPGRGGSGPVPGCCRRSPTPAARPWAAPCGRFYGNMAGYDPAGADSAGRARCLPRSVSAVRCSRAVFALDAARRRRCGP